VIEIGTDYSGKGDVAVLEMVVIQQPFGLKYRKYKGAQNHRNIFS